MPLQPDQFLKRLATLADADLLCEVLDIDSEDIIERFNDKIEENIDILRETFDVDIDLCIEDNN
jgi:hypothetical protein|tara:strand:- start:1673 stop:1864 length:192 start_codon:yes stop_codon:yes gene_type:complete